MAKYRPDIKPPMWGPPDAVQYAVRANAERMGIDYSKISVFLATWEGGGNALYGPVGGPYAMGSGCQWSSFGLYTNGSSSGVIDLGNITIGSGVATIIQRVMCDSSNVFSLSSRSGATSAGYEFLLGYGGVAGRARLRWQDSSSHFSTTIGDISGLNDGKYHSLCAQFTQDVGRFYADGTLIVSDPRNGELNNSQNCFIAKRGSTYMQGYPNDTLLIARNSFTEDQIAQLHATPYALLMPVSRPVYFDLGATSGGTLTTDSSWKIYTAAEIDTAWSIRAALSQSSAWAVFTRADAESAWSIRTSAEAETAWTVRADLATETAWPIATAADTPTEWQIKAGIDTETAWPIFTAVDTATAWAILDSLALETPTAWAIRNALAADAAWSIRTALDAGSAWAIFSRLDRETAWQILGAGILDTPTAWEIRADLDHATAWTIKTSLAADTDWTIVNGMDTVTAWDILQGFATDTAWPVFHGLDTATAWSIISDIIPEPVRVFMAEPRDFIINAEKRIFILLAERK